jgi:hypothetical protein
LSKRFQCPVAKADLTVALDHSIPQNDIPLPNSNEHSMRILRAATPEIHAYKSSPDAHISFQMPLENDIVHALPAFEIPRARKRFQEAQEGHSVRPHVLILHPEEKRKRLPAAPLLR